MGRGLPLIGGGGAGGKAFQCPRGGLLVEEASAFKTCFQKGPRPTQDAFNQGGLLIKS